MITLYRGDDTTFKGVKRLRVTIESKESLAGCSATFEVCGVVKHVPDVSTGSFYLSLTGEDTAKMPLGTHTATLRVYDDESRRRTVANTIMVCVTERIGDAYPGEEDIAVSLGAMVEWRNVSDKPSVNGVVLEGNKTTKELGIKGVVEATLVDLPEDYTPEGLRAAVNAINACLRASMACAAVAACALFAPCAAWAENGEAEATESETETESETTTEATEDEAATDGETPSRVTVREFGDMTSMNKQFKALSNLTAVVTAVDLDGLAEKEEVEEMFFPSPALTEEQTARGLTYEKNGIMQDGAVQIGRHAVATVDPAFVENAPSGTVLRSVSVAIGDYANARADGMSQSQSVAIGWFSQAKGGNSIAIGSGAQHTNETAMSSGATVATGSNSIALGYTAKATANNSVQIGIGTNSTPNSLQFQNVPIVRDGKLAVDGTINTNDVEAIIDAYLAPRSVEELPSDGVLKVRSHAITTFAPTNATMTLDEIIAEATATRNYEIYIPNVAATREGLPLNFDTEDARLTKVGPWWGRKALRLPMLVKVREPIKDTVILDVETYDDGWDWTPAVTNAEWEATEDGAARRLKKVQGYNLQGVTAVRVAYEGTDGETNIVTSTAVGNALYGTVWPTIADIAEADIAAGTEVVVSVVADGVSAPKATLNALTESVTEILKSEKEGWR